MREASLSCRQDISYVPSQQGLQTAERIAVLERAVLQNFLISQNVGSLHEEPLAFHLAPDAKLHNGSANRAMTHALVEGDKFETLCGFCFPSRTLPLDHTPLNKAPLHFILADS